LIGRRSRGEKASLYARRDISIWDGKGIEARGIERRILGQALTCLDSFNQS
jgi:hypothetical protein